MKKSIIAIAAICTASCTSETTSGTKPQAVALETTTTVNANADRMEYGTWRARIENTRLNDLKLIVTGTVEPERPNAKVILTKIENSSNANSSVLILKLSKRPIKQMRDPKNVSYEETMENEAAYKKVLVLYRNDTVALLTPAKVAVQ